MVARCKKYCLMRLPLSLMLRPYRDHLVMADVVCERVSIDAIHPEDIIQNHRPNGQEASYVEFKERRSL